MPCGQAPPPPGRTSGAHLRGRGPRATADKAALSCCSVGPVFQEWGRGAPPLPRPLCWAPWAVPAPLGLALVPGAGSRSHPGGRGQAGAGGVAGRQCHRGPASASLATAAVPGSRQPPAALGFSNFPSGHPGRKRGLCFLNSSDKCFIPGPLGWHGLTALAVGARAAAVGWGVPPSL